MLYTDCQSGRIAAIARHMSFAQITCIIWNTSDMRQRLSKFVMV